MDNHEVFAYPGDPGPAWLDRNSWYVPVDIPEDYAQKMPKIGLKKIVLKVAMCCPKCAEIVAEEIKEVRGVFDVKTDFQASKVTVLGRPYGPHVLKKARKIDRNADYWPEPPPPPPEPPKPAEPEPEKPKEEEKKPEEKPAEPEKPKEEEKKTEEKKEGEGDKKPEEEKKADGEAKPAEEKKEGEDAKPAEAEKPEEAKPKDEVSAVQYPPYQFATYQYPPWDYRPSQSYNPLLGGFDYRFQPQVFYDYPYFKTEQDRHVDSPYEWIRPAHNTPVAGSTWNIF